MSTRVAKIRMGYQVFATPPTPKLPVCACVVIFYTKYPSKTQKWVDFGLIKVYNSFVWGLCHHWCALDKFYTYFLEENNNGKENY